MNSRDGLLALKRFGRSVADLVKQAWQFPGSIPALIKRRQQKAILNALEAERLDRIRNPSDYRGK